jgi:multidrug efflux pump subunit AcrA (membrane-fusion protein)
MKKRRWPWVLGVLAVIGTVAGIAIWPSLNQKPEYETYEVVKTEVVKTVSANGQLAETQLLAYGPAEEPILISANGALAVPAQFGAILEIVAIEVSVGDEVEKDQLLFSYRNQLNQEVEVSAVAAGVVRSIDTLAGLRTGGSVLTIGNDQPVVSVFVSEYDADLVSIDQLATIELDAIDAVFEGKVIKIGQVAQSVSGIKQYEVLIEVNNVPTGARYGMSSTAEIKVQSKENVFAVPLNSFVGEEKPELEVLVTDAEGNQTLERREVTIGLLGNSFVEITSGLSENELVVTGISGSIPAPVNFGPPPGARQSA